MPRKLNSGRKVVRVDPYRSERTTFDSQRNESGASTIAQLGKRKIVTEVPHKRCKKTPNQRKKTMFCGRRRQALPVSERLQDLDVPDVRLFKANFQTR